MRLRELFLLVTVAMLAIAGAPAEAAEAPAPSLAAILNAPASCNAPAAAPALEGLAGPEPFEAGSCNAQTNCVNGSVLSCNGSSYCFTGLCSVHCDGVTSYCCDISALACPQRACVYCACIHEGIFTPQECSDQACSTLGGGGGD